MKFNKSIKPQLDGGMFIKRLEHLCFITSIELSVDLRIRLQNTLYYGLHDQFTRSIQIEITNAIQ